MGFWVMGFMRFIDKTHMVFRHVTEPYKPVEMETWDMPVRIDYSDISWHAQNTPPLLCVDGQPGKYPGFLAT